MNAVVTLGREALIRRLNPHLATLVSFEEVTRMRPIHWQELLTPRRFDVVAKLVYARARLQGRGKDWATEAYREHLRVWSGFVERDGSGKDTFDKFQDAFDTVIDTIASRGFDAAVSVLPIGLSGGLIDGSHRAAACIATQQDAWAVDLAHDGGDYSAEHFRTMGLSEDYLDAMAVACAQRHPPGLPVSGRIKTPHSGRESAERVWRSCIPQTGSLLRLWTSKSDSAALS